MNYEISINQLEYLIHSNYPELMEWIFEFAISGNQCEIHEVSGDLSQSDYFNIAFKSIKKIKFIGFTNFLLNKLCKDKIIEKGVYKISY